MVDGMLHMMLGSLSPALDFIKDHPVLIAVILLIWMLMLGAGKYQLGMIQKKTGEMVLEYYQKESARRGSISAHSIYKHIDPIWEKELPSWGYWYILNKTDILPVRVKAENVRPKMKFSPEWIQTELKAHDIILEEKKLAAE